jgi:8-oxo-dGTP pyrophosphatase MutT (NUDIX family)
MDLATIVRRLGGTLQRPLPGTEAQVRMAPRPRPGWDPDAIPDGARAAAALLLLYPRDGRAHLLLTLRPAHLPQHAGQVSLPGGAVEQGESAVTAALREVHEEVGVEPESVTVLGTLTPLHIPVSRFVLHPVLGVSDTPPRFVLDPREVDRVLEVEVERLCDPATVGITERQRRKTVFRVPHFGVDGEQVWGATAMILAELLWLLGCPPDPWGDAGVADG